MAPGLSRSTGDAARASPGTARQARNMTAMAFRMMSLLSFAGAAPRGDAHVGDPAALSPREAGLEIFALETGRGSPQPRRVGIVERVDVDHGIEMVLDPAGRERHGAASRADIAFGAPGAEPII